MVNQEPIYNFDHPLFQNPLYKRYAREHLHLQRLVEAGEAIDYEVTQTVTPFKIPTQYRVHYHLKSIIAVDEFKNPLYGYHHIAEITIPPRYPLEPCILYMKTDTWHPNIKSQGPLKGRICGNIRDFGRMYTLDMLVLRIGEILQYQNYLAEFVPPYPEDPEVAEWVLHFAEPNGIVDKKKGIAVDYTPLVGSTTLSEPIGTPEQEEQLPKNPSSINIIAARNDRRDSTHSRLIIDRKKEKD